MQGTPDGSPNLRCTTPDVQPPTFASNLGANLKAQGSGFPSCPRPIHGRCRHPNGNRTTSDQLRVTVLPDRGRGCASLPVG